MKRLVCLFFFVFGLLAYSLPSRAELLLCYRGIPASNPFFSYITLVAEFQWTNDDWQYFQYALHQTGAARITPQYSVLFPVVIGIGAATLTSGAGINTAYIVAGAPGEFELDSMVYLYEDGGEGFVFLYAWRCETSGFIDPT